MKASELEKKRSEQRAAWERERLYGLRALHADVTGREIPVYVSPPSRYGNCVDYDEIRFKLRAQLLTGQCALVHDVECDHCNTPIINREPGVILASDPPQISVGCPGCGWLGSLTHP
jgi:hypothetical protein